MGLTEEQIYQALSKVNDPEYPLSIVDLGMIYGVEMDKSQIKIMVTFTAMGCPAIDMIISDIHDALSKLSGERKVTVEVVWNPPWTKEKISSHGRQVLQYYGVGF